MEVEDKIGRREWNCSISDKEVCKNSRDEMDIFYISGNHRAYYRKKERIESEILNMEEIHCKILSLMEEKYEEIHL